MRSKRLFTLLLTVGVSTLFIALRTNPASIASVQDARAKQDGFINGCSDSVIDPLDECIQERFSKVDTIFGIGRVRTTMEKGHKRFFRAETEMERIVIANLERSGVQVGFYLCGGSPHYDSTYPEGILAFDAIFGPVVVTPIAVNWELPANSKVWRETKNALRSFKEKNQYEFAIENWKVAARPIRARESCLDCHRHKASILSSDAPEGYRRLKAGDVLGVAMYAYARAR